MPLILAVNYCPFFFSFCSYERTIVIGQQNRRTPRKRSLVPDRVIFSMILSFPFVPRLCVYIHYICIHLTRISILYRFEITTAFSIPRYQNDRRHPRCWKCDSCRCLSEWHPTVFESSNLLAVQTIATSRWTSRRHRLLKSCSDILS